MSAAGESSSEAAPARYQDDCKKTAEIIKDKAEAAAGGRWYVAFPKDQSGNLGREIRLEYDTGIALVCTSGKRPADGIDVATRGLAEALADLAANEGVTGGIVLYDCLFRWEKMSDERILAARAARVAARRGGAQDDGDGGDARPQGRRNSHVRTSKSHREGRSRRPGDASAADPGRPRDPAKSSRRDETSTTGSGRHRDQAKSSRRDETESGRHQDPEISSGRGEVPNIDDINRFRRERSDGGRRPGHDDAYYFQEEWGNPGERSPYDEQSYRAEQLRDEEEMTRLRDEFRRLIGGMRVLPHGDPPSDPRDIERPYGRGSQNLRYDQLPRDPRDLDRPSRSASSRNPDRHGRSSHQSRRRNNPLWPGLY